MVLFRAGALSGPYDSNSGRPSPHGSPVMFYFISEATTERGTRHVT